MKLVSLISACALSLGAAGSAQADAIFNNFGPNYAYDTNGGWIVGITGLSSGAIAAPRMLFTSNGDYSVTQIDLALGYFSDSGAANAVTVALSNRASRSEMSRCSCGRILRLSFG